jgi:hypothetical protein
MLQHGLGRKASPSALSLDALSRLGTCYGITLTPERALSVRDMVLQHPIRRQVLVFRARSMCEYKISQYGY